MPWDFSYETIWPYVQKILEPFNPVIGAMVAVIIAGMVLGFFAKRMNS